MRDNGIDCDYRPNHVHVAMKPRHLTELKEWARELHEEYGYHPRACWIAKNSGITCAAIDILPGSSTRAAGTCTP